MRTRALALGSTLAFLMLSGPAAWADTDSEYEREGAYLGLGGVGALANTSGRFSSLDSTGGIDLIAGYRMAPQLGIELFGEWLGYQGTNAGFFGVTLKLFMAELFDQMIMDGVIQPYLYGSAGFIMVRNTRDNMEMGGNFRGGAGVDFYVTPEVAIYTQVEYSGSGGYASGIESTNFKLGALYRF
ncbi:MAG: outer membrane beta-barrel protein [Proteobacteria bacterium]|nr:outer membrane beta-barrel protein [Pseudomonadota bacterium]